MRKAPRLVTLVLSGVCGLVGAPPAAATLDEQLALAFHEHLRQRPANPAAKQTLEFIAARPAIRLVVDWAPEDDESWAEWKQDRMEVVLSSAPFAADGIFTSSGTLSGEQLKGFFFSYGSFIVHELSHARTHAELPFFLPGTLEDEVLAWTVQARYLLSDGRLADPAAELAGRVWVEELWPLTQRLDELGDKIREVARLDTPASRLEHKRLYALYSRRKAAQLKIRARLSREFPGQGEGYWQALGFAWAFERGCPSLRALVKALYPSKPVLTASADDLALGLADERRREKLMEQTCPQLAQDTADRMQCEETLASIRRSIGFWSDPARPAVARRYFEEHLASACSERH